MPNKNVPNGFYMFMQEEQRKIKAQTKRAPSMQEMAGLCKDSWKNLGAIEKAHYDTLAKQEKARQRGGSAKDFYRKDNQRQIIAHRADPAQTKLRRRQLETQTMKKNWEDKDLLNMVFHIIDFQVMYDERREDHHLPMEVGLVTFTLKDGLQRSLHTFIHPGDVPQGNRHTAQRHSENTHQIPLDFEKGTSDYLGLWNQIQEFLADGEPPHNFDYPPLFCLSDNTETVDDCLEFLHARSGTMEPNRLHKVYCMEDMVASLICLSAKSEREPALSQLHDALKQNIWDYTSSIRCSYHEEMDCSYCSLSIVRRYSFAAFDLLSTALDFDLTPNHVPEEPKQQFSVLPPEAFGRAYGGNRWGRGDQQAPRGRGRGWGGGGAFNNDRGDYSDVSPPPVSAGGGARFTRNPRQARPQHQVVGRFEQLQLSDEDQEDDEEYPAIKSTSDQYTLKELRKPKTPFMMQIQQPSSLPSCASQGRGRAAPLRSQTVSAPPGMMQQPRPYMMSATVNQAQAPPPRGVSTMSQVMAGQGRGRGRGLGRGLPPQI